MFVFFFSYIYDPHLTRVPRRGDKSQFLSFLNHRPTAGGTQNSCTVVLFLKIKNGVGLA